MKKTAIILIISLLFSSIILFNCSKKEDLVTPKYEALKTELTAKMKEIKSREQYQAYQKDRKEKLNTLLTEATAAPEMDSITLLIADISTDLRKFDDALTHYNTLIEKNSEFILDAKYGKLKTLLYSQKGEEALKLYPEIKNNPEFLKKEDRGSLLMGMSYSIKNQDEKLAFMNESVASLGDSDGDQSLKGSFFNEIASVMKDQGKLEEAIAYLKDAKTKLSFERAVKGIDSKLAQLELFGNDAPEFSAENWLNSKALELPKLKGKVVLLDFWAPWCAPCRAVIPHLVKLYDSHNKDGLVVIGITKLYGSYRDDQINKGKVDAEEERKLIGEFLPRFEITYPVAIADQGTPFEKYGVRGIPTLVVIDKEGKVHEIQVGSGNEKELEAKVLELLQK